MAASSVRVRFAPSPTGQLHLGGLRTALFNYLFAKHHNGTFILRIEDTDQTRLVPGAAQSLERLLTWAGVKIDEGPTAGGPHGPYVQSQRLPLYHAHVDKLLECGHAYRCFCSTDRLTALRSIATKQGTATSYDRACRDLPEHQVRENMDKGMPFTVRLRMPLEGETHFEDKVYGHVVFENRMIEDQVLLKSDKFPTYHLANVVDDHDMRISHVLRGEEWMSSTAKHIQLYTAFGWTPPAFGHMPLLLQPDRQKISKRTGGMEINAMTTQGYLPLALCNFVAFLGWHPSDDSRQIYDSMEALAADFDISGINKSPAIVDLEKLKWTNKQHMHALAPNHPSTHHSVGLMRADAIKAHGAALGQDSPLLSTEYLERILLSSKTSFMFPTEIVPAYPFFWKRPDLDAPDAVQWQKSVWNPQTAGALEHAASALGKTAGADLTEDSAKAVVEGSAAAMGIKVTKAFPGFRYALAGTKVGPAVPSLMACLGAKESLERINIALQKHASGAQQQM